MNILQAQALLKKMQHLCDAIASSPTDASRIEVDLLKDYTRRFYEILDQQAESLNPVSVKSSIPSANHEEEAKISASPQIVEKPSSPLTSEVPEMPQTRPQPKVVPPFQPQPAPIPQEPEQFTSIEAELVEEENSVETETKSEPVGEKAESKPSIDNGLTYKKSRNPDTDILFEVQQSKDLSDKLRFSKIDDLSKAMGINERFLTINELFGGDHEVFDTSLRDLNAVSSFEDARSYIETHLIPKYHWLDTGKQKKALVFIQLVYRRFV